MAFRAFVSSTFEDLREHRAFVIDCLRDAGFAVDPMENWTAADEEPRNFSAARATDADLMVLLVAFRRGHRPEGEKRSITQLEYDAAVAANVDVLAFMLDDRAAWPARFDERAGDPAIGAWRAALRENHGVGFFNDQATSVPVAPALTRWVTEREGRDRDRETAAGAMAPGALRIVDVRVTQQEAPRGLEELKQSAASAAVDFWVSNEGGSQVIVTGVELEVVDTARCELVKGAFPSSATYDLDLTDARQAGQRVRCPVSQMIAPGESDRFTIRLVAPRLGSGVYAAWCMLPRLQTNYGVIDGPAFEAWLPYTDPETTFDDLKGFAEAERQSLLDPG